MAHITIKNVWKRYGKVEAVKGISLECKDKEFVSLLGPSGCGKSSTLRMIAGLEEITEGDIYIDDTRVNDIHSSKRNIAMVFETYALYPNKTVFGNMAYPLRIRNYSQEEIKKRVSKAAEILDIHNVLNKYPRHLSGGQRQRVAIGRAIVRNPKVFLMDEPISHLDAKLRAHMRSELKHLQKELSETFVYVTHDQLEAMSMADRIAVMNFGVLQQFDTPDKIYDNPANVFVGGFVGEPPMNFISCVLESKGGHWFIKHEAFTITLGDRVKERIGKILKGISSPMNVILGIRPEDIKVSKKQNSTQEVIRGEVYISEPLGSRVIVDVMIGKEKIKFRAGKGFLPERGSVIFIEFDKDKLNLFDAESKNAII
jgi:multiple sugar transport system ATP-binding protein